MSYKKFVFISLIVVGFIISYIVYSEMMSIYNDDRYDMFKLLNNISSTRNNFIILPIRVNTVLSFLFIQKHNNVISVDVVIGDTIRRLSQLEVSKLKKSGDKLCGFTEEVLKKTEWSGVDVIEITLYASILSTCYLI